MYRCHSHSSVATKESGCVQVCPSSAAHQMAALSTCSRLRELQEVRVAETSFSSFPGPTRVFLVVPPPTPTYAQNSWTATTLGKRRRNEIMHGLAGVGQEAENSRGKARKKKKNCTLARNARNSSALQFSTDNVTFRKIKYWLPLSVFPVPAQMFLSFRSGLQRKRNELRNMWIHFAVF